MQLYTCNLLESFLTCLVLGVIFNIISLLYTFTKRLFLERRAYKKVSKHIGIQIKRALRQKTTSEISGSLAKANWENLSRNEVLNVIGYIRLRLQHKWNIKDDFIERNEQIFRIVQHPFIEDADLLVTSKYKGQVYVITNGDYRSLYSEEQLTIQDNSPKSQLLQVRVGELSDTKEWNTWQYIADSYTLLAKEMGCSDMNSAAQIPENSITNTTTIESGKDENSITQSSDGTFHWIIIILLVIRCIRTFVGILENLIWLPEYPTFLLWCPLITNTLFLMSCISILNKKKWGFYSYIATCVVAFIVFTAINNDTATNIIICLGNLIGVCAVLLVRNNGKSGYDILGLKKSASTEATQQELVQAEQPKRSVRSFSQGDEIVLKDGTRAIVNGKDIEGYTISYEEPQTGIPIARKVSYNEVDADASVPVIDSFDETINKAKEIAGVTEVAEKTIQAITPESANPEVQAGRDVINKMRAHNSDVSDEEIKTQIAKWLTNLQSKLDATAEQMNQVADEDEYAKISEERNAIREKMFAYEAAIKLLTK